MLSARPLEFLRLAFGGLMILKGLDIVSRIGPSQKGPTEGFFAGTPDVITPATGFILLMAWGLATFLVLSSPERAPVGGVMFFVLAVGIFLADRSLHNEHLYLVGWIGLVLALVPFVAEVDLLWLMRVQLSIVYGFAALAKLLAPDYRGGDIL